MKTTDKEMDRLLKLSGPELIEIYTRLGKLIECYKLN